jgi:putative hydrolase of the HAD superfamily
MRSTPPITHLFLDIGGVLLTNGWDHNQRKKAALKFKFGWAEMEHRHRLTFELFETGKLTLSEYLERIVFYQKRPFTEQAFRHFMLEESKPFPKMIELMTQLKARYQLKVIAVSNEARELNTHRITTFKLGHLIDTFISSCYVHVRKPDMAIFQLALDISQAKKEQVLYIENTPFFVELAQKHGIRSLLHKSYAATCKELHSLGLSI